MQKFFKCFNWPGEFQNVWLGVTAENQARADERIPILLQIPAAVRFVSVEPMLSAIDLDKYLGRMKLWKENQLAYAELASQHYNQDFPKLNWCIAGAETGPGKRPMDIKWALDLQDQCQEAGIPFFFKKDSNGEFPAGFRREYPKC